MFFGRNSAARKIEEAEGGGSATKKAVVIPFPKPRGRKVEHLPLEEDPRKIYEETAKSIGFMPAALLKAQLLAFFKEEGIELFDNKEVYNYLKEKAEAQGKKWHWRPLRNKDRLANYHIPIWNGHGYCDNNWECRVYDKEVPLRVLLRIKQIEEKFKHRGLIFLVSDYSVPHPDPFIAVYAVDVGCLIFDVWDEPEFGVK